MSNDNEESLAKQTGKTVGTDNHPLACGKSVFHQYDILQPGSENDERG
jgi:hypothetical protein